MKTLFPVAIALLALLALVGCIIVIGPLPTPTLPVLKSPPTVTPGQPQTMPTRQPQTATSGQPPTAKLPTTETPPTTVAPATLAPPSAGDPYADRVLDFKPGSKANARFGNPQVVIGAPDFDEANLRGFLNLGVGGLGHSRVRG
ncbi:MAG: hypothetical protein HY741_29685 [Chloroflexi bacterium]|nr:hypothetical protein [Chloroflexota bacterium]